MNSKYKQIIVLLRMGIAKVKIHYYCVMNNSTVS